MAGTFLSSAAEVMEIVLRGMLLQNVGGSYLPGFLNGSAGPLRSHWDLSQHRRDRVSVSVYCDERSETDSQRRSNPKLHIVFNYWLDRRLDRVNRLGRRCTRGERKVHFDQKCRYTWVKDDATSKRL